jgi:peptidoglycan/xylan/chitin deacetylase (PgdA/CDA1 family)
MYRDRLKRFASLAVVGVIAMLTTLGLAALGIFAAQQSSSPPNHVAGPAFPNSDQGTSAPAAQLPSSMTPWPDLADLTKSDPPVTTTDSSDAPSARSDIATCEKPDAMGVSRVVEIDTTGGAEFGLQHLRGHDFLRDREVVLTFDDGPRPVSTVAVLKALQDECLKATFFEIGQPASWHPEITKQVIDAGMTVGTHTWSHKDLARDPYAKDLEKAVREIEMGNSAVHMAVAGAPVAPFFRFPSLQQSPLSLEYLAHRNIAVFSTDIDSRDFTMHKPEQVIDSVMSQLKKRSKGIVLLHDFHRNTAEALPELLRQLKLAGYKVVHMVSKEQLTTISKYDEMFDHRENLSSSAEPGSPAAPGHVAATHHRRSMYMHVPTHGSTMYTHKKDAQMTRTNGGY